jgi:hypothetical protein
MSALILCARPKSLSRVGGKCGEQDVRFHRSSQREQVNAFGRRRRANAWLEREDHTQDGSDPSDSLRTHFRQPIVRPYGALLVVYEEAP